VLPKWVLPLLLLFVVFFILSSPNEAGPQARMFFGWIGEQAVAVGTFLDGLFGEDVPAGGGTTSTTVDSSANNDFSTLGDYDGTFGTVIVIDAVV